MRATAYVISDRIRNNDGLFLPMRLLRALELRGVEIGSHSVWHRDLTTLDDREALRELVRSRRTLERGLQHPVQWSRVPVRRLRRASRTACPAGRLCARGHDGVRRCPVRSTAARSPATSCARLNRSCRARGHAPRAVASRRRQRTCRGRPHVPRSIGFDLMGRIELVQGDITTQAVDAIVNAANSSLLGGGGVDGAIHRAGGPAILEECRLLGGCDDRRREGHTAGKLPARHVIHTVGPVWQGGDDRRRRAPRLVPSPSLEVAAELGCRTSRFRRSRPASTDSRSTGLPDRAPHDGGGPRAPSRDRRGHASSSSRTSTPGLPAAHALVAQPGQSSGFRPRAQRFESSRGLSHDTVAERRGTRLQSAPRRFDPPGVFEQRQSERRKR